MTLATPPVAAKKPHVETHHGVAITDDYAWLRDPGYPEVTDKEVLAHLEAENAWFEAGMAPDQVEALAFAWLAAAFVEGAPGNLVSVTGAVGSRRLGALYPAR